MVMRLTREAFRDLSDVDAYLADKSPQGLRNVIAALKKNLDLMESFPNSGKETDVEDIRISVEPRYGYIIPYYIKGDEIWILRVYHSRRIPLDYTSLKLP
jgi:toxin ParE1/3/4